MQNMGENSRIMLNEGDHVSGGQWHSQHWQFEASISLPAWYRAEDMTFTKTLMTEFCKLCYIVEECISQMYDS